ncbi:MAG: hypothetical protein R3C60_14585 [Parvularculaceae bacterium]
MIAGNARASHGLWTIRAVARNRHYWRFRVYALGDLDDVEIEPPARRRSDPSAAGTPWRSAAYPLIFAAPWSRLSDLGRLEIELPANIHALKALGATDVISLSACGSFREELSPGAFVLADQFIDRTSGRRQQLFRNRMRRACVYGETCCLALGDALSSAQRWHYPAPPRRNSMSA